MNLEVEMLRPAEAAELTKTPVETLRYWRRKGFGPRSFRIGRRVFYMRADVLEWIEVQASGGPSPVVGDNGVREDGVK
ncbi:helix-turn-helix transcriptional regulator [Gordonia sputi]|uniref:helix-turn-helix transcriptional regulator n=1 Tax=Gordonia sputi TaxID=36823 RepID=UPI00226F081C|nr:helix-turn-helix domain-containing protein [Gordonia sputi]